MDRGMLSIGKLTLGQSRYYERQVAQGRDDYYSGRGESPGRWIGSAADGLGLSGQVDEDGFVALMEGRHPGTGEPLKIVAGRSKVAAFDLTFSAPKSVSVLFVVGDVALAGALVEAHEAAVAAALGYLEREACRVRRGRGGARREVGEGFVAAAYRHRMSRAEDPQLHTHVVAANMARGTDGRWTALDATPVYRHAKAAGYLYQAHLRAAVRERLPWVHWGPVHNGMAEIEQLAPELLRGFSTRRRQIEERERELIAAGVSVGDAGREAITHDTRARKRYGIDTAPWREVVRARAAEHGLGARELKALTRGRARAPERPDAQSVSAQLAGAAGLTERQNTFARRDAVMAWAAAHDQGAAAALVESAAAQFLSRPDVHRAPDPSEVRFTTSNLLAHEKAIVDGAQARRGERSGRLDDALVEAALANARLVPTAEQVAVIRRLTSSGHGVESVEALAGTGKTFTAGLLARAYVAGGYRVLGTAPTARAVRELKEEAGITQASTLTRLALDLDADPGGFGMRPAVLIVDEAGMASTRETARVLERAATAQVKVIAIGDSGQLSSVQAGGWLGSLTRRLGSYELREVMRQRDPRERVLLEHVRRGDPGKYLAEKAARGQLHVSTGSHEAALEAEKAAITRWRDRQAASPTGQAVLIARDNARRARLNALARVELQRQGLLGESILVAGQEFAVGDRVIARRNDRLRELDNGMRGTIIAVDATENELLVRTDAGADRALDAAYTAEHLEHAYALTAHTIQGGTVEWAGVVGDPDDFTRNWSYTALSRARDNTEIFLIETPTEHQLDRAEIAPSNPNELVDERTPIERLEAAMRRRDDEDLALDRIDHLHSAALGDRPLPPRHDDTDLEPPSASRSGDELRTEVARLRELHAHALVDQIHALRQARSEAQRIVNEATARIVDLDVRPRGMLRGSTTISPEAAFERERLNAAERQLARAAAQERELVAELSARGRSRAEHEASRERGAASEAELPHVHHNDRHGAVKPYLTVALGPFPDQRRARRTWQHAAQYIDSYRSEHGIEDASNALGPEPARTVQRARWREAQRAVKQAQLALGRTVGFDRHP
jgi:conjugative relaxase-like TrwC/TraI family protein